MHDPSPARHRPPREGATGRPREGATGRLPEGATGRPPESATGARPGERRTIIIRGQTAGYTRMPARRPGQSVQERAGARPDRIAMWAVMLGLLLLVVAATTAHA